MIASLMMYARPELEQPLGRYWALIRDALARANIKSPASLAQTAPEFSVWTDPALVLSQTCGMPYRTWLHPVVRLVGTPDYGVEGCAPGFYRSAIVVRADDPRATVSAYRGARFAFNQLHSQSGFAAPFWHFKAAGFWFGHAIQSHGHQTSAQMIAKGDADIAAVDAVTWRLIQRYDAWAKTLRVLDWTAPSPGLPYITAAADPAPYFAAVSHAIGALGDDDRATLGLRGVVQIGKPAYLNVQNPPRTPTAMPEA